MRVFCTKYALARHHTKKLKCDKALQTALTATKKARRSKHNMLHYARKKWGINKIYESSCVVFKRVQSEA